MVEEACKKSVHDIVCAYVPLTPPIPPPMHGKSNEFGPTFTSHLPSSSKIQL